MPSDAHTGSGGPDRRTGHHVCAARRSLVAIALAAILLSVGALVGFRSAVSKEAVQALPEGSGLAAGHPGDKGLGEVEGVLVFESFEMGTVGYLSRRWNEVKNPDGEVLRFVDDAPRGAHGVRALEMKATVGTNTGGHLYRTYPGQDLVFLRFYVRFLDEEYIHHFVTFGGYRPATRWPQGHAGKKPNGNERFTVGIEPHGQGGRHPAPGVWSLYTYWHEMKSSADGAYWGNALRAVEPLPVPKDRWQCVEVMVKLNSASDIRDGELALWLDGKLESHFVKGARRGPWSGMGFRLKRRSGEPFGGFSWRSDGALQANMLSLSLYVTERAMRRNGVRDPVGHEVRVRFDHVVIATRYVGPFPPRR